MRTATTIVVTLGLAVLAVGIAAQQAGFKRTTLQQSALSVPGREAVTAIAEFQAGATVGGHTHPGEEIGYILEGAIVLEQEGKTPVTLVKDGTALKCGSCHRVYPIKDDIPVMLIDEATVEK